MRIIKILSLVAVFAFCGFGNALCENRVFTDGAGKVLHVKKEIKSVVSLAPSITEIVFALGRGNLLSGVTRYSDYPAGALRLPIVGSYIRPDIEKIVSLKPDLVIATTDGNPNMVVKRLTSFGIPVYVVDPKGLKSVVSNIRDLGLLLGADAAAHEIAADMEKRIAAVKSLVAKVEARPSVFFQIGVSPIVSIGSDTFIHEMILVCGGINMASGEVPYPRFSREQVIGLNPDVILVSSMAREESFNEVKKSWERWPSISAVGSKRVHVVDSDLLDRPTPRMVSGLEKLARLIHPELFLEENKDN